MFRAFRNSVAFFNFDLYARLVGMYLYAQIMWFERVSVFVVKASSIWNNVENHR